MGLVLGVLMKCFLESLAKKVQHNPTCLENYRRIFVPECVPLQSAPNEPLKVNVLFKHIQARPQKISPNSEVKLVRQLSFSQLCSYEVHLQWDYC
jgi:hypothetical protein